MPCLVTHWVCWYTRVVLECTNAFGGYEGMDVPLPTGLQIIMLPNRLVWIYSFIHSVLLLVSFPVSGWKLFCRVYACLPLLLFHLLICCWELASEIFWGVRNTKIQPWDFCTVSLRGLFCFLTRHQKNDLWMDKTLQQFGLWRQTLCVMVSPPNEHSFRYTDHFPHSKSGSPSDDSI